MPDLEGLPSQRALNLIPHSASWIWENAATGGISAAAKSRIAAPRQAAPEQIHLQSAGTHEALGGV